MPRVLDSAVGKFAFLSYPVNEVPILCCNYAELPGFETAPGWPRIQFVLPFGQSTAFTVYLIPIACVGKILENNMVTDK